MSGRKYNELLPETGIPVTAPVVSVEPTPPPEPEEPKVKGNQIWTYVALRNFDAPEFQNSYRLGREYSFRTKDRDDPRCDNRRLLATLPSWVDEGKVKML